MGFLSFFVIDQFGKLSDGKNQTYIYNLFVDVCLVVGLHRLNELIKLFLYNYHHYYY